MFYRDGLLMVSYVDDAGVASPTRDGIDTFVSELRDLGFDLDIEGDFSSYLGIKIDQFKDRTRHMSHKGLIEKVILAAGMKDCNPN